MKALERVSAFGLPLLDEEADGPEASLVFLEALLAIADDDVVPLTDFELKSLATGAEELEEEEDCEICCWEEENVEEEVVEEEEASVGGVEEDDRDAGGSICCWNLLAILETRPSLTGVFPRPMTEGPSASEGPGRPEGGWGFICKETRK